jgi:hypothetical protein
MLLRIAMRESGAPFKRVLNDAVRRGLSGMRTSLDIDDDVLAAARALAQRARKPIGRRVSELARAGLRAPAAPDGPPLARGPRARYGIASLPSRGGMVTGEVIDRLRGDDAY